MTGLRRWLTTIGQPLSGLVLLLVATEIVGGFRVLGNPWQGGDLLYHSALANAVLRGELPPGGPYAGLPAYYPPGFHIMAAAVMAALGVGFTRADQLLTLAWLPVLPIGTFLLVRHLTGRPWVALLAATLTVFGGAYDLRAGRLWVNSLFMAGQEAYPLYPRDVVFALLPFGVLAFMRALTGSRRRAALGWSLLAGAIFGGCALVQVQLLLPLPFALAVGAAVMAIRHPPRRWTAFGVLFVTGAVASVLLAPWLLGQLADIRRNGGVALDSADTLLPAVFGPWEYPRQFGLLLPLGLIGAGVTLLFLRRPDGPRPAEAPVGAWRPAAAELPLILSAWFGLAFVMGVLYQPGWPLEDALRPQRMWLLSGQPMTMLAAIGLATLVEDLAGRLRRPGWATARTAIVALVAAATLVVCVPTTIATARLLADTWRSPSYAALDIKADHVPAFASILPRTGPRATVLTYEDWSSLAWYETGDTVVGLLPAGFAKLAYDPAIFTDHSQPQRRDDLLTAFDGSPADLATIAARYDASRIVVARRGDALGWLDAAAVPAADRPAALVGVRQVVEGNGWDAMSLAAGSTLDVASSADGTIHIEVRVAGAQAGISAPVRSLAIQIIEADGSQRSASTSVIPATAVDPWQVVRVDLEARPGDRIRLAAEDPVVVQSIRGFTTSAGPLSVGSEPAPGWRVARVTADAVVLEPSR